VVEIPAFFFPLSDSKFNNARDDPFIIVQEGEKEESTCDT
jgi:hypothetical protein